MGENKRNRKTLLSPRRFQILEQTSTRFNKISKLYSPLSLSHSQFNPANRWLDWWTENVFYCSNQRRVYIVHLTTMHTVPIAWKYSTYIKFYCMSALVIHIYQIFWGPRILQNNTFCDSLSSCTKSFFHVCFSSHNPTAPIPSEIFSKKSENFLILWNNLILFFN